MNLAAKKWSPHRLIFPQFGGGRSAEVLSATSILCAIAAVALTAMLGACQSLPARMDDRSAPEDAREIVSMNPVDAIHFRSGMRGYLSSLHEITDAISRHDRGSVAQAARASGLMMIGDEKLAQVLALPPRFVLLAAETHMKFDSMAAAADAGTERNVLIANISEILANCSACHQSFRLVQE